MNNENKSNDPIERLFREKAEEYNISYREEDWLKLEKQLDVRDMQLYYRRRIRWLAAASVLILSLIGYYTLQNSQQINQLAEQMNQTEVVEQNEPQSGGETAAGRNDDSNQTASGQESTDESGTAERGSDQSDNVTDPEASQNEDSEASADEMKVDQTDNFTNEEIVESIRDVERKSVDAVRFHAGQYTDPVKVSERLEFYSAADQPSEIEKRTPSFDAESSALTLLNDDSIPQKETSTFSKFAVGFVISPDLSTAGSISNFYDPGFKGGILAEYFLSRNISVSSGLTLSNLKYKAAGQEYTPPESWNYGVMPDQTRAVCLVLDIPVNLKANLKNFGRSRIFATAGLSSYIMLNENYRFSYEGNDSGQSSWSDRTGTRHWLSNAGLSVGIEYDLSPNWTIRVEPHIKIPLKGVGWGSVDLYSMGSFFSINYKL